MTKIKFNGFFILLITIALFSCKETTTYDLAIKNVKIFDSENKKVLDDKTILIKADTIYAIVNANSKVKAIKYINGKNRLVSPGFIDTHIHLTDVFGDYEQAPEFIKIDSSEIYRKKLSDIYLKYGVTTILGAGQPEKWLSATLKWQQNPNPNYPNIFNSGGAIISDEERTPYIGHVEVENPEKAIEKINEYHKLGIKHIKIYWRLKEPEMKAIIERAKELHLYVCGHIDQNIVSINNASELGLKNFEHFLTLSFSVFRYNEHYSDFADKYNIGELNNEDRLLAMMIQTFKYIDETPKLNEEFEKMLDELVEKQASISTTIHLLASLLNKTYFTIKPIDNSKKNNLNYNKEQLKNLDEAYSIMMKYLKKAYDKGIKIRIGTDCREGGKALLSELMLLYEAGFSMEDIFQIATLNGAEAIKIDSLYGSIESGKKADLIIFEKNPFENYKNILSNKIIIKDGIEYKN